MKMELEVFRNAGMKMELTVPKRHEDATDSVTKGHEDVTDIVFRNVDIKF
jgi:hypothetical protein